MADLLPTVLLFCLLGLSLSIPQEDLDEYNDSSFEFTGPNLGEDEQYTYKSACLDNDGKLQILSGFDCRRQVAVGKFKNAVNSTGWSFLEIETKAGYPAELQAYAAGALEGNLTSMVLNFHIQNTVVDACKNFTAYCGRLNRFIKDNLEYIQTELKTRQPDDLFWAALNRTFHQLTGLYHGFDGKELIPGISFELHPILNINMNGEFYDLERKFNKTRDPAAADGKCSGLIKVAPNNADLFISQVTMSGFENMMRILKLYKFAYDATTFPGHTTTFAGYPGMLYSSDDFALMSSGLAVIETTINVFNNSLYKATSSKKQLSCWIRAIIANQLARTGKEWCEIFERYNSGTYNNQWVILDYKMFTPGKDLPNYGLLYVLEQLPGYVMYRDTTWFLRKYSYFPSYNIPFYKKITQLSGFDKQAEKMGSWFKWGKSPRALIFDRDHGKVKDLDSLTKLMRSNDYTKDEFSRCNCQPPYSAEAAISARGDLNPANGTYEFPGQGHKNHGGLDYKGTNYAMMSKLRFRAWGGPTYDNVPPFQWSKTDFKVKHLGHPDLWKFQYVDYTWETDVEVKMRYN